MSHNYIGEFRQQKSVLALVKQLNDLASEVLSAREKPLQVMEVCGGHTHSIYRYGLHQLISPLIEFIHGPGCPVCVLPRSRIDDCIGLAAQPNVILATFGDAMRVPGGNKNLLQAKADGCDVRVVYSPLDALHLAQQNPNKQVIFFALGFETTMPATAITLQQAKKSGVENFYVLCQHIVVVPTLSALLKNSDVEIDAFIGPGHVSAVIGTQPYDFIARDYHKPFVITGFEPVDLLQALIAIVKQIQHQQARVECQYSRVVKPQGNALALAAINDVFEPKEHSEWRGLGNIAYSGVKLRNQYRAFDAEHHFDTEPHAMMSADVGECGDVLTGKIKPTQCRYFGKQCTPDQPVGALMVSSEGACAACFQHA